MLLFKTIRFSLGVEILFFIQFDPFVLTNNYVSVKHTWEELSAYVRLCFLH